jgi:hypothetical protein
MIRYALTCEKGHDFESWFADSAAFETQRKRKLVSCPRCASSKVEKAIMSPRLSTSRQRKTPEKAAVEAPPAPQPDKTPVAMISPQEREVRAKLRELRNHLTKNADDVGPTFPEQARKMHYGEIEHRSIYGVASPQEAKELAEEGVEVYPLPVLPDERN